MELATPGQRLKAFITDILLGMTGYTLGATEALPMPVRLLGLVATLGLVVYQIKLLTTHGQTIGKRFVGIRIVRSDTYENGGFKTNVLLRVLLNGTLDLFPIYFIIDALLILRPQRRGLRDYIAGTVVVTDTGVDSSTE